MTGGGSLKGVMGKEEDMRGQKGSFWKGRIAAGEDLEG